MALPLEGVKVVALEQAVAAPFCSRHLADLGADIIKVEREGTGDFARGYDDALGGLSAYFAWLNRGKRSIVLDVKHDRDRRVLAKLIARADIFLHNLAPGAVERLGFGYPELAGTHPRLIWCGISGYGPDGPYRDKRAYDLLVQGESGIMSVTGTPDTPAKAGVAVADISAGLYAYSSILAALYQRQRTGKGARIDISMLECLAEWMSQQLLVYHGTRAPLPRTGVRHSAVVPYGLYACADADVNLGIQNEREWKRFCDLVLEQPALAADPRFCSNPGRLANRVELEAAIEDIFRRHSRAEILARLDRAEIANGAVNDVPALAAHPQLAARNRWREAESPIGPVPALLPPHNLAGDDPRMGRIPALGEHTREILAELEEGLH